MPVVIFASSAGLRYMTPPTSRPRLTRSVRAAIAASIVFPSNMFSVRSPTGGIWWKWSMTVIVLKPELSAVLAMAVIVSKSPSGSTPG